MLVGPSRRLLSVRLCMRRFLAGLGHYLARSLLGIGANRGGLLQPLRRPLRGHGFTLGAAAEHASLMQVRMVERYAGSVPVTKVQVAAFEVSNELVQSRKVGGLQTLEF